MTTKEGSTEILNDAQGNGSCAKVYESYSEIHYFFKNRLLYTQA